MKDYLVKAIDKTKNLRLITVDAKDLVSEAQKRHDYKTDELRCAKHLQSAFRFFPAEWQSRYDH